MIFAADWGVGQVVWSLLYIFFVFLWIWFIITLFSDIIRSRDLSGWAKAAWAFFIIILPILGALMYLIVRGDSMADRAMADAQAQDEAVRAYIRDASGGSGVADEIERLGRLHDEGKLSDDEFASLKGKLLQ